MSEDMRLVRDVAERVEQDAKRARRLGLALVALIVAVSLLTSVSLLYLVTAARREATQRARSAQFGESVVLCLLDELGELRAAAEAHYQEMAEVHAKPVERPSERPTIEEQAPPEAAERLERACAPVLEGLRKGRP